MSKRDGSKTYSVTFVNKAKGTNSTVQVRGNEYILDAAEIQEVDLPYACRAGACVVCAGKVLKGSVDQSDHSFLRARELDAGFVLTCRACATSDCVIETHQEDALFEI